MTKPNSKRGRVRAALNAEGAEAAAKLGEELGVSSSKIKRWLRIWAGGNDSSSSPEPDVGDRARSTLTGMPMSAVRKLKADPANRVVLVGSSRGTAGTIVQAGPEQSVVRWDSGAEAIVPNEWVRCASVPDPKPEKRRRLKPTVH